MHGGRVFIPLILTAFVVMSSGCVSMDATAFAKAIPMVQDFLEQYPNANINIVHYSEAEAEAVLDQIKEDCGKLTVEAKDYYFVNITDPDSGLVVRAWIDWNTQTVECVFKEGVIVNPDECTSKHSSTCYGDHVYWFDSCGNRQEKKEYCPLGCSNGACIQGDVCELEKSYTDKPDCTCPDGYEMMVLYPRCTDSVTGMITGMPFAVTDTKAAEAVTTESGAVEISDDFTTEFDERCPDSKAVYRCVKREQCKSHAQSMCYKGHVFWYDSCGHVQEKKEYCNNGCEQGFCKEGSTECSESDEGYDVYNYGCAEADGSKLCDHCNSDGTLTEKACEDGGGISAMVYECPGGYECSEGACVKTDDCIDEGEYMQGTVSPEYQTECCTGLEGYDTSGGLVGAPLLCYDPQMGTPQCKNGGTEEEGWYYSMTNDLIVLEDCEDDSCTDSDDGKNYYVKGTGVGILVNTGTQISTTEDKCFSDTRVQEYYCNGTHLLVDLHDCSNGCQDGVCYYPGFMMSTDQETYSSGDTIELTIEGSGNVDLTVQNVDAETSSFIDTLNINGSLVYYIDTSTESIFDSSGLYGINLNDAGEDPVGGYNTNGVSIEFSV